MKAQSQAYVTAWRLRASDLRATHPGRADIYEVCADELEDALSPTAPDDGKGQPAELEDGAKVMRYWKETHTDLTAGRSPHPAPQGWQQGAAELVGEWRKIAATIHKADSDSTLRLERWAYQNCADVLEAFIKRHSP